MYDEIDQLVRKTEYILREAKAQLKKPCVLWSMGKDSTAILDMIRNACFGEVPFPVLHIDNGLDFKETYEMRDKISKNWDLDLIVVKSEVNKRDDITNLRCCGIIKQRL